MTTRKNPHLVRQTQRPEVQQLELEDDPRQLELIPRVRVFAFEAEGDDETVAAALATVGAILDRGGR